MWQMLGTSKFKTATDTEPMLTPKQKPEINVATFPPAAKITFSLEPAFAAREPQTHSVPLIGCALSMPGPPGGCDCPVAGNFGRRGRVKLALSFLGGGGQNGEISTSVPGCSEGVSSSSLSSLCSLWSLAALLCWSHRKGKMFGCTLMCAHLSEEDVSHPLSVDILQLAHLRSLVSTMQVESSLEDLAL